MPDEAVKSILLPHPKRQTGVVVDAVVGWTANAKVRTPVCRFGCGEGLLGL